MKLLRIAEVAERLAVGRGTVRALLRKGKLKHHRIGAGRGSYRISEEHLAEFLEGAEGRPESRKPVAVRKLRFLKI